MIRVLIVDGRPSVRQGLRMQLLLEPDLEVIGEAASGEEALALVPQVQPDVVLMDVKMPGMDGIPATRGVRAIRPQSTIVLLSLYDDARLKAEAQAAGAAAFVGKQEDIALLLTAIRQWPGHQ
jgi:DNA-binding NarL/FixJ family response regulator